MAPKKAVQKASSLDAWKAWLASEYNDPGKFQANLVCMWDCAQVLP